MTVKTLSERHPDKNDMRTRKFYEKCGFRAVNEIKLRKIEKFDTIRFVELTDEKVDADRFFTVMSIQKYQ